MVTEQAVAKKTKKILIIDDEPEFCEDIAFLLDGPYEITAAHCSLDGMRLIHEFKPDLIILDLVMPAYYADAEEDEGLEMLKRLKREELAHIPVLVLTKMEDRRIECLAEGAEGFVMKPPTIKELADRIESILN